MGAVQLTLQINRFRFKPKAKTKAHRCDLLRQAFDATGEFFAVDGVIAKPRCITVSRPEPAIIQNKQLDADRFGLATLHQLRGRVGRGRHKSYCVLVSDNKGEENKQRLKVMSSTSDGFAIAEEDLKLRGPGDFFGSRQHGLPSLRVADLSCDLSLLHETQSAAEQLLAADPALKNHPLLKARVELLFELNADAMN